MNGAVITGTIRQADKPVLANDEIRQCVRPDQTVKWKRTFKM